MPQPIMNELTPSEVVYLSLACLRLSNLSLTEPQEMRWRARAASAFHQAGVTRHRRLFLSDIITDFEAGASERDPPHAVLEQQLLERVNDQGQERVARYYETAIAYSPDFAESLYNLATLRRQAGRTEEALALFLRAAHAEPHAHGMPHAYLTANAFWEAACIETVRGCLEDAELLFREALLRLDNFGPEHVRFPRLLQRLGKNEEALDHFERITSYSHRYSPEFIEPDYLPDERLPQHSNGTPLDPSTLSRIDGAQNEFYYFGHLYFDLPKQCSLANLIQMSRPKLRTRILRMAGLVRPMRCSPTPDGLIKFAA
jgi:tetratricopeptide (TPR) repeat protein